ncbi:MAG: putative toxin-antitoxin system toxin component, PIN family [Planctomycetes bacterium]|nr:putative toxin-antitoxin system toxin component, PIN family [Planctomycetota bacterium]
MIARVCWDTNPLISAAIVRHGVPRQLLDLARAEKIDVIVSPETLSELARTLREPRIARRYGITEAEAAEFEAGLREFAVVAPGVVTVDAVPQDPQDNHVLAAAVETRCGFVVTGDQHLLSLRSFRGIEILPPRELLERLREQLRHQGGR